MSEQRPNRGQLYGVLFVVCIALMVAFGALFWSINRPPESYLGPEGVLMYSVPNLASASTTLTGKTVDGITCQTAASEVVNYHVHVHVAVYVNGKMMRLPAGIGITQPDVSLPYASGIFEDVGPKDCLYWLHTHVADGIIHVEAPVKKTLTLGQFFDIWNQPLGPEQLGSYKGKVVVFENGKRLSGNPRSTPLLSQGDIQIEIGNPIVPFQSFAFKVTGGCGESTTSCTLATPSTKPKPQ